VSARLEGKDRRESGHVKRILRWRRELGDEENEDGIRNATRRRRQRLRRDIDIGPQIHAYSEGKSAQDSDGDGRSEQQDTPGRTEMEDASGAGMLEGMEERRRSAFPCSTIDLDVNPGKHSKANRRPWTHPHDMTARWDAGMKEYTEDRR
jgi:hypothetical protein